MTEFAELSERDAEGEIARIYGEIRDTYGAPYVSSLQRHFATYPGVLEWAWGIVAPGFHNGLIPQTASRIARDANHEQALTSLSEEELRALGVNEDDERTLRNVCENFVRVAPLNLLFAGCIRALLEGTQPPSGAAAPAPDWQAPEALPPLPPMCDLDKLAPAQAASMKLVATHMGDQVFVPGLYRMLALWPAYFDHIAALLGPRLAEPGFRERGENLAQQIVDAVPMVLSALPQPPELPTPDASLHAHLCEAIATYRRTSPEMVMIGSLLRDQLPSA
jgi:hypothetical protein